MAAKMCLVNANLQLSIPQKKSVRILGLEHSLFRELRSVIARMDISPKPSLNETLSRMQGEVGKKLDASVKDTSAKFSGFLTNVQTWKSKSEAAISSSVLGFVQDFTNMRRNVERNVKTLTSGGVAVSTSSLTASAPAIIAFPPSTGDILEGVVSPQADKQKAVPGPWQQPPSFSSSPTNSISSNSVEDISEETPHPDHSSVSATSVFSIGYVGPPLLGRKEPTKQDNAKGAPTVSLFDGLEAVLGSSEAASALRLEDVRKSIGRALIVYKKIRSLGFRESSWENKMPWRNPRPSFLAKGLQWPQQKFSSVGARREYHNRARRRGHYLIGPTPGWSWFAADVVFLYFLINNRGARFLI